MERTKKPDRQDKELIVLTMDPSLTGWGYVVLNSRKEILCVGCIKTEPQHKKRKIRASDDRVRRIREINNELLSVIDSYKVNFIVSELPHGSQNASAAIMVGLVPALGQTIADCLHIPMEWFSENDAKQALLHKNSATKDEVLGRIHKHYKVPWTGVKYKDEAIADSLAVHYAASKQSTTLMFLSNE